MKILKWLDRYCEEVLLSVFLIAITVIMVAQIILRYCFKSSLVWAEELSCILLVWSGFISISYTLRRNTAMRLTMLVSFVPRHIRNAMLLAAQIIMLVFFGFMAVQSIELLRSTQQATPALGMPMIYLYLAVFMGFVLSAIRCIQGIIRIIRRFGKGDELNWDPSAEETKPEELSEGGRF